ncbi:MAG: hypothetical protein WKF89_00440 [Chitinophagaceae bacterium]
MRKWLIVLLILLVFFNVSVFLFIPATLNISKIVYINCSKNSAGRYLLDQSKWQNWWPGNKPALRSFNGALTSTFSFREYSHQATAFFTDKIEVLTRNGHDSLNTILNILPADKNLIVIQWRCSMRTSLHPITRILEYRRATRLRNNMSSILTNLQTFLEKTSNVYGFHIEEIISKDSTLVATRYITAKYPGTVEVYGLIDTLRDYISRQGATETNHPMLRISKINENEFQTMVAIATNKKLPGNGPVFFQHFVPWKTLTGTVNGGTYTIEQAFRQLEVYVSDNQRTSMAVPFQLLVTDRTFVKDSSKWVTVICQPVS